MGLHIYIYQMVDKPALTPEAETDKLTFEPIGNFRESDWESIESLAPDKLFELFNCEGLFLEELDFSTYQLPFIRVKDTDEVISTKARLLEYLKEENELGAGMSIYDFFQEGIHLIKIG